MKYLYADMAKRNSIKELLPDIRNDYLDYLGDYAQVYLFGAFLNREELKLANDKGLICDFETSEGKVDTKPLEFDGLYEGMVSYCVVFRYRALGISALEGDTSDIRNSGIMTHIYYVNTMKTMRKHGIATRLIKKVLEIMADNGTNSILSSYILGKESGELYKKCGFKQKGDEYIVGYNMETLSSSPFAKKIRNNESVLNGVRSFKELSQEDYAKCRLHVLAEDRDIDLDMIPGEYSYAYFSNGTFQGCMCFLPDDRGNLFLSYDYIPAGERDMPVLPIILSKVVMNILAGDSNIKRMVVYCFSERNLKALSNLYGEPDSKYETKVMIYSG